MGLTDRLAAAVVGSETALDRPSVESFLRRLAVDEAPLATSGELRRVVDEVVGLGVIEELLRDDDVTDVLVNRAGEIWIERRGRLERSEVAFEDDGAVIAAIERAITPLGLRIDRASPIVDARLPDGSRLHAIVPPATPDGPVMAIRRFTATVKDLEGLAKAGAATQEQTSRLREAVVTRQNLIVSGGTGTGKTTLLNVLSSLIPPAERIVVVEDAAELKLAGHVVRLEAHPPNAEGAGGVELGRLMRSALRLRPDRIVLGEVRGPEALDLLTAFNSGHAGSMSTVHANDPRQALRRLQTLAMAADRSLSPEVVARQMEEGIDVVVQLVRGAEGRRRITEVATRPW
jgi:pilus assembly protein CpaF